MSRKRIIPISALIIALLALAFVLYVICKNWQNRQIEIEYVRSPENMICSFDGKYYYTRDDGVYCDNQQIIKTAGKPFIYTHNDTLYVYDNRSVIGYDKSFTKTESYDLPCDIIGFVVNDKTILYYDKSMSAHILIKATGEITELQDKGEIIELQSKYGQIDKVKILRADEFDVVYEPDSQEIGKNAAAVFDKNTKEKLLYLSDSYYCTYTPEFSDEKIIISGRETSDQKVIYEYDIKDHSINKKLLLPKGYLNKQLYISNDWIVFIGTDCNDDPRRTDDEDMADLSGHKSDNVCVIDPETLEIKSEIYTKQYEVVLYADTEKNVTYFKGKIYTKDTSNGDTLDSYEYDKFKPFGKYKTAVFDEHIFVFEKDGELIDVIKV